MRPLIGIPCHAGVNAESDRPIFFNNRAYTQVLERAGGMPILIPIIDDLNGLHTLLPRLDGLLLSGGIDVDPRQYQEEPHPQLGQTNPQLDELELTLARWALEEDVPTLGICRGMQLLNVAFGGSLYQDLSMQFPGSLKHGNWDLPRNTRVHSIEIEPGTRMEKLLGLRQMRVNSLHHQATKKPGDGIVISGYARDGVPELLEVPGHRFMFAAQCHPEEIYADEQAWPRLFHAFIDACSQPIRHTFAMGAVTQRLSVTPL
jgi:putative glutamine amidotransferase